MRFPLVHSLLPCAPEMGGWLMWLVVDFDGRSLGRPLALVLHPLAVGGKGDNGNGASHKGEGVGRQGFEGGLRIHAGLLSMNFTVLFLSFRNLYQSI